MDLLRSGLPRATRLNLSSLPHCTGLTAAVLDLLSPVRAALQPEHVRQATGISIVQLGHALYPGLTIGAPLTYSTCQKIILRNRKCHAMLTLRYTVLQCEVKLLESNLSRSSPEHKQQHHARPESSFECSTLSQLVFCTVHSMRWLTQE